jgi:DNA-directed RNA polymerase subunit beta
MRSLGLNVELSSFDDELGDQGPEALPEAAE